MSYRDPADALRAHRERVASDLTEARLAAEEASERARQVKVLEKELSETDALLASMTGRRTLPLLDDVRIAAPCKADWDEMTGDDRVRHCAQCEKDVYDLSAMTRADAEAFLLEREGGAVCLRLYRRRDGTVLTADCPVGVRTRRRRRAALATVGGGLIAAAACVVSRSPLMQGGDSSLAEDAVGAVRDLPVRPESSTTVKRMLPGVPPRPRPDRTSTVARPRGEHRTLGEFVVELGGMGRIPSR
ncbi:MAG: hypothetical protein JOZ69_02985 [Myxococcales bacterium]|nr:hypothetical protein [Myxococcales bacterium]